jgi:diguanylate cyclase (GGDEF)-like protein/PAS domain S-box-containing protein
MATRRKRAPAKKAKQPARKRPVLTSLSSDWYWEQDASLRFVRIEVQAGAPAERQLVGRNLGRRPWETGVAIEGGWDAHRALLRSRAPFREVLMWRDFDDGSRRYISVSGEPVFDAAGRFAGYRGVGRDITQQKRGEQLLQLQHTVTRSLAEAAGPVEGAKVALRAICELEGWDCGELWRLDEAGTAMRRFADWVSPAAGERYAEVAVDYVFHRGEGLVGAAWQSGEPLWIPDASQDARVVRKSRLGRSGAHAVLLCPVHSHGEVTGVLDFMCRRIRVPDAALLEAIAAVATQLGLFLQRAEAQARLSDSEERFRRTFELAGSGLAHLGMDRRFLRVNRKLCAILGYSEQELIGRSVLDVSHPEDLPATNAERERLYRGDIPSLRLEKRYVRKDGCVVWAALTLSLERDAHGVPLYEIAVYDDVTARKAAEHALRENEERYRRTFELAGSGVAHVAMDGRLLRVNRRMCEMFGYPEHELVGISVKELSHRDDRDVTDNERTRMHRGEIDLTRFQKRYLRKDGSTLWVEMAVTVERDASGTPLYEIAVMDDIGARKAAELAVQESEARFRRTFELAGVGVAHIGPDRRFQRVNRRFCEILGYPEAELVGRTGRELSHPEDLDHMNAQRPRLYAGEIDAARGEKRYLRKDGSVVWVAYTLAIERDAAGKPLYEIAVYDEVTARKRAEQLLRLEHQVARALSEARNSAAGVTLVMQLICEAESWGCGRAFRVDEATDRLVYRRGWTAPGSPFERFLERSRDLAYQRGQGLAGTVWQTGEPLWSVDTSRDPRVMAKALTVEGARGAFLIPVKVEGHMLGVLAFTSQEVREPDERLLQAARVIGSQVGQFLQRMRAEEALRESEARFRALTEMSSDFYWETDAEHRLVDMTYGRGAVGKPDEALNKVPWDIPSTHPDETGWGDLRAKVDARQPFRDFEFGRPRRDGGVRWFAVSGEPRFGSDGRFVGYRGVGRDITEVVLARERIASLAFHDPLTGLANRVSLAPALEQSVERTRRRGSKLAGLFLDLDGFKQINDMYGHDAGDRLLVEAAQRLRAALRSTDPVARLGGDEFFVVLEDLHSNAPAERVAKKLLEAIHEPYDLGDGRRAMLSASIGVSVFPDDAGDATTLMKHADGAMYAAKQAGKNAYRFFTAGPAANDGRDASNSEEEAF